MLIVVGVSCGCGRIAEAMGVVFEGLGDGCWNIVVSSGDFTGLVCFCWDFFA